MEINIFFEGTIKGSRVCVSYIVVHELQKKKKKKLSKKYSKNNVYIIIKRWIKLDA